MRSPRLQLSQAERQALFKLTHSQPQTRGVALRARIVLRCAAGKTNSAVASEFGVSQHTVGKWLHRYLATGLEGLKDQPRSGKPRQLKWDVLADLIESTVASSPPDGERWTIRNIALAIGIPPATATRIWRYSQAQRHRSSGDTPSSIETVERGSKAASMSSKKNATCSLSSETTTAASHTENELS